MIPYPVRSRLNQARVRVERQVRAVLFGDTPTWKRKPNRLPWFDRPDALARVDRRAGDAPLLERWIRDGYVVVEDVVDLAAVDEMVATLDGLWEATAPVPGLVLLDLRDAPGAPPRNVSHAELLTLDVATRRRMRALSDWRIHGFHYVNAAARRLYQSPRLRAFVSRLFGRRALPIAAINFMAGSQQKLHQDMAVFHIYPHNYLIGAWIACEDIVPGSGPLILYRGSHRAPMFPEFTDYPQTNLRTVDEATAARYQDYVDDLATRFEPHEFWARKGQVLLWHGMLIHGGSPITVRGTTRKSLVLHYSVRGADRAREVRGPFRW